MYLFAAEAGSASSASGLPNLTPFQYNVVDNFFSLTVATMGAAALFFFISRNQLAYRYRPALMVSGLVVAIACYHYFMIRMSWQGAYKIEGDMFVPTGKGFNDFYRYADWILTVPLLMVELIAVMNLASDKARSLLTKLVVAAALMIGLGYPGEISTDWTTRLIWGVASSVPFVYILYVLWVELSASLDTQPQEVRGIIQICKLLILVTWAFYPIAYAIYGDSLPNAVPGIIRSIGISGLGVVGVQIGYAIADITAKAGFGMLIYYIALTKSELDPEFAKVKTAVA